VEDGEINLDVQTGEIAECVGVEIAECVGVEIRGLLHKFTRAYRPLAWVE
jgi:hypothetical protein